MFWEPHNLCKSKSLLWGPESASGMLYWPFSQSKFWNFLGSSLAVSLMSALEKVDVQYSSVTYLKLYSIRPHHITIPENWFKLGRRLLDDYRVELVNSVLRVLNSSSFFFFSIFWLLCYCSYFIPSFYLGELLIHNKVHVIHALISFEIC